jgi:hypothetical protein
MNNRLAQLKLAAEKVTTRNPDQFAEIYGRLILNDLVKSLEELQQNEPGEVKNLNPDSHLGWQIAVAEFNVRLQKYFK